MSDDETRELPPVAAAEQDRDPGAVDREPGTPMADDADTAAQGAAVQRPTAELPTSEVAAGAATIDLAQDVPTTELPTDLPTAELPTAQPPAGAPTAGAADVPPATPGGAPGPGRPAAEPYAASSGHIRVTTPAAPQPLPRTTPRVGTVVWGLMVAAVGVGLLSIAWGAHLDAELAFIVLLGAAGVALLVGSLAGMRRSRNRMEGRD